MDINAMTNEEIWKAIAIKAKEHPEALEHLNAVYAVQLTGEVTTAYRVSVANGKMIIEEKEADDADCTLTLSFKNFKKLLQGNLNATAAFMTGKLKAKGNIGLALKLEQTLKEFSF